MNALSGWENFYVIVGSSAGALIGLQFVVITLISNMPITAGTAQAGEAFSTPTIIYFATALLLSAIACAPWHGLGAVVLLWGALGLAGILYTVMNTRRIRGQNVYEPQFEDWMFHVALPLAAYAALGASAVAARSHARAALFGIAAVSLLLLFIGIHNAWDSVTWHVFVRKRDQQP